MRAWLSLLYNFCYGIARGDFRVTCSAWSTHVDDRPYKVRHNQRNQLDRSVCGLAKATFVEVWIWFVFEGSVAWPTCLWGKKRAHSKVAVGREKFDICKSIWNVKSIELANKEYFHEVRIPPEDSINEVNRASKWRLRCLFSLWSKTSPIGMPV